MMARMDTVKDQNPVTRQDLKTMQRLVVSQVKSMFMLHIGSEGSIE
jgi:hypothetical protein